LKTVNCGASTAQFLCDETEQVATVKIRTSHDGVFFEIDVENLWISRRLDVGAEIGEDVNILMGSFIWAGEGDGM
jgi:hypothetical protein